MGSKFLGSDSTNLSALVDGTFQLNVASAIIQSLAPSLPLKTTATKQLISGLIQLTDCNFSPLTNPASANLSLANYAITNVKETTLQSNAAPLTPDPTNVNTQAGIACDTKIIPLPHTK